jgi:hypothetical protein
MTTRMIGNSLWLVAFILGCGSNLQIKASGRIKVSNVELEIGNVSTASGSLHWKIRNRSDVEVYVYDVFLLGPAFEVQRQASAVTFSTAPTRMLASCPPNRFLPVLLMVVRPCGTIEGIFSDSELKKLAPGTTVSMQVSVGPDPYSVAAEWQQFLNSNCEHSPYDAIVRWGTTIESNAVRL